MNTRDVLEILKQYIPQDAAFVASLGRTADEAFTYFPRQTLFLDSMGDITSVACGLALGLEKTRHPVVALDTDGSHLMGLSILPTLANLASQLPNLLLIVLDNGMYEAAGGLPSREVEIQWPLLGQAMGIDIQEVRDERQLTRVLAEAFTRFLYLIVRIENTEPATETRKTLDGIESTYAFIRYLEESVLHKPLLMPAIKS